MYRTAVLAGISANAGAPPHIFRFYETSFPPSTFSVCEVARAAIALGGQFSFVLFESSPVQFTNSTLVGHNNTADVADLEAGMI